MSRSDSSSDGPATFGAVVDQSRALAREAFAAREAGDIGTFTAKVEEALALRPSHPQILYYCAVGHAEGGNGDKAIGRLRQLAEMGLGYSIADEPSFEPLQSMEAWSGLVDRMSANLEPTDNSTVVARLDQPELLPEGVAYDPRTRRHFVGGIRGREIWSIDEKGKAVLFAEKNPGLGSVFGLLVDEERRRLHVATAWMGQTPGVTPELTNTTSLLTFDLDSGEKVARAGLPKTEGPQILNDLCLSPRGDLYVTDNQSGSLYRYAGGELEEIAVTPRLVSPQGVVLGPSGDVLYIADYSVGIVRVDPETGKATRVSMPSPGCFIGIDGLARHGQDLIAVQNGVSPHRILRMGLSSDGMAVESVEVLEKAHPEFDEPTLGVVVGDAFHYVANSQWPSLAEDGGVNEGYELRPPTILSLPVGRSTKAH